MKDRRWNSTLKSGKGFKRGRESRVTVTAGGRAQGRTATGELRLFEELYLEQRGRCAVTGDRLHPPGHPLFHCQGSHLLPKGSYRRARLWRTNVVMILKSMHDIWGNTGNKEDLLVNRHKPFEDWRRVVERYFHLQRLYNTTDYNGEELVGRWAMDATEGRTSEGSGNGARRDEARSFQDDDLPF